MAKKQALPTMENQVHPDITAAAEEYVKIRDKRMKLTQQEVDRREVLRDVMAKHKLEVYEDVDVGLRVEIVNGDSKVKVKRLADDPAGEGSEE